MKSVALLLLCTSLTGCAGLVFHEGPEQGALSYFEPQPYFFVTTTAECVTTGTVVSVPGKKKSVSLKSGYGSAELSVNLTNGMITSVGQTTDTKVPETISAVASLATAAGVKAAPTPAKCKPSALLYPIDRSGRPSQSPLSFPVKDTP